MPWWSSWRESSVRQCVCVCVCQRLLPQRRHCYLLLLRPRCYTSLSCRTTLLRSITRLILTSCTVRFLHINTHALTNKLLQNKTIADTIENPTVTQMCILPVGVDWLYALPARVREIIVMHSRLVIFSILHINSNFKTWKAQVYQSFDLSQIKKSAWTIFRF